MKIVSYQTSRPFLLRTTLVSFLLAGVLWLVGCSSTARHPQKYYDTRNYEEAVSKGRLWLEVHPEDDAARILVAKSALAMKDTSTAYSVIQPLQDSTDPKVQQMVLETAFAEGDLPVARKIISRQAQQKNESPRLDQQFAIIQRRMADAQRSADKGDRAFQDGNYGEASGHYRSALRDHAAHPVYRAKLKLTQAEILVRNGSASKLPEALSHIETAITLWPDSALPWYVKGDLLLVADRHAEAKKAFETSLEMGLEKPYKSRIKAVMRSTK